MIVMGIDPGATGAVAVIHPGGLYIDRFDKVGPVKVIVLALEMYGRPDMVWVEKVHAMPGQGVTSMFSFGTSYGKILGVLEYLQLPMALATPQEWQKWLPDAPTPKERARLGVAQEFDLGRFVFAGCRVPHQGAIDATAMAMYGVKIANGELVKPLKSRPKSKRQPIKLVG